MSSFLSNNVKVKRAYVMRLLGLELEPFFVQRQTREKVKKTQNAHVRLVVDMQPSTMGKPLQQP